MSMSLDIDLLKKAFEYKHKGYEVLIADKGLYVKRHGEVILLVDASRLVIIQ